MYANKLGSFGKFREQIQIKDVAGIIVGALMLALGIQVVLIPAHLLTGGVTGIAIILNLFTGYAVGAFYLVLNIPIFIAGYKFISRRFCLYSILGTLAVSTFLGLIQHFNLNISLNNELLSAVLGGTLNGIGIGVILKSKGSSGGTDILAVIVKRFWGYSFGETSFAANLIVIGLSLITANLELTLFSAITIFISSRVVDSVESGLNISKTVIIVSNQASEIADQIINNLHRGCTYLKGEGAYTGADKNIIMTTVGKTQLPHLKEIVFQIDRQAFITISETIEVLGKGFKPSGSEF